MGSYHWASLSKPSGQIIRTEHMLQCQILSQTCIASYPYKGKIHFSIVGAKWTFIQWYSVMHVKIFSTSKLTIVSEQQTARPVFFPERAGLDGDTVRACVVRLRFAPCARAPPLEGLLLFYFILQCLINLCECGSLFYLQTPGIFPSRAWGIQWAWGGELDQLRASDRLFMLVEVHNSTETNSMYESELHYIL